MRRRATTLSRLGPMVDAERLHRILRGVSDDVAVLATYASRPPAERAGSNAELGHIKYTFVTAIEGCIDAAQHVCAAEGWGPPDSNAGAMRVLGEHGAVHSELATALAAAVGFRNVLVHGYAKVDDHQVVKYLDHLGDLDAYVSALALLITE